MRKTMMATTACLMLAGSTLAQADEPKSSLTSSTTSSATPALYGTLGLGSSQPFRPGRNTLATEVGARLELAKMAMALTIHQEGGRMLRAEPTATMLRLDGQWTPNRGGGARYTRIGGGLFMLLTIEPALGLTVEAAHGWHLPFGDVGGFVQWQSPWSPSWNDKTTDLLFNGLTTGAEFTRRFRFLYGQVRAGLVGGRRPWAASTVGAGWRW